MKKISKIVSALVLSGALILGIAPIAFADVVYDEQRITITGSGEYTPTDMFDNFKDVMPGDGLYQPVFISNESKTAVKVYMKAVAHDAENGLTYSEDYENADGKDQADVAGQRDETVATMQDFLNQMTMQVKAGDTVAFDGSPAAASDYMYLGQLASGQSIQLDVSLTVPVAMNNTYAYRVGEVDWVFLAEEQPSGISQTGDFVPLVLAGIGVVAVAAVVLMVVASRKRRSQQ